MDCNLNDIELYIKQVSKSRRSKPEHKLSDFWGNNQQNKNLDVQTDDELLKFICQLQKEHNTQKTLKEMMNLEEDQEKEEDEEEDETLFIVRDKFMKQRAENEKKLNDKIRNKYEINFREESDKLWDKLNLKSQKANKKICQLWLMKHNAIRSKQNEMVLNGNKQDKIPELYDGDEKEFTMQTISESLRNYGFNSVTILAYSFDMESQTFLKYGSISKKQAEKWIKKIISKHRNNFPLLGAEEMRRKICRSMIRKGDIAEDSFKYSMPLILDWTINKINGIDEEIGDYLMYKIQIQSQVYNYPFERLYVKTKINWS